MKNYDVVWPKFTIQSIMNKKERINVYDMVGNE